MNYLHLFLGLVMVILVACQQNVLGEEDKFEEVMPQFATYFEPLTIEDTVVISHWDWGADEVDSTSFGNAIPNELVQILFDSATLASMNTPQEFYGLYTITSDSTTTGYVIRTRMAEADYMQETYVFWKSSANEWLRYAKIAGFIGSPGFMNQTRSWWTTDGDVLKATIRNYNFVANAEGQEREEDVIFEFNFRGNQLETKELPAEKQFELRKIYDLN